jgi:hypothetical protein
MAYSWEKILRPYNLKSYLTLARVLLERCRIYKLIGMGGMEHETEQRSEIPVLRLYYFCKRALLGVVI